MGVRTGVYATRTRVHNEVMVDRETVERLAADTGLAPEEIDPEVKPGPVDERAVHLSKDTGVDEEELKDTEHDPMGLGLAGSPPD
jgi:hypothetical protein